MRIEIVPKDFNPDSGEGTPTVDLCLLCASDFAEGDPVPDIPWETEPPDIDLEEATVGAEDVAHPDYEEGDYRCQACGSPLTAEDL